ncbi:alpha-mannosidase 1a [Fusarium albosuccineum]|uniref:alpha-1,2-Mannosidase n=1 Tax=Fusarium albosuccineum TaxID=1237068 RepID=A0A8H4KCS8_9HYPO|nr:alpha-mannosidase 1a [Fusarium albosuccineum]
MARPPRGSPSNLPRIQHDFSENELKKRDSETMEQRRVEVKQAFEKTWAAYEKYAWGRDELKPLSLEGSDTFSGWAATIVDNLDTLWIMDMKRDFYKVVDFIARLDWDLPTSDGFNVFETTIRHLGGLLSAYELSGESVLLAKAIELGDLLYATFDNPERMPPHTIKFHELKGGRGHPEPRQSTASLGSMTMEFTRLSQQTGNPKYYDAVDYISRAFERTQNETALPGLWPLQINAKMGFRVDDTRFGLGANGDSLYEYLIKEYVLLQGLDTKYEKMYLQAADATIEHLMFRPRLPGQDDLLMLGEAKVLPRTKEVKLKTDVEHLTCFAGGMFALGGRALGRGDHVVIGDKLARGCAHAYSVFPHGLMPEIVEVEACPTREPCEFIPASKKEPLGFQARDRPYLLRPEAIESIFVLYRITGNQEFRDIAWNMWTSIKTAAETKEAFAAVEDVTAEQVKLKDYMESFWMAETLKYFYLIFSDEDVISLDEWVFNTEAHPLRRMSS